MTSVEHRPLPPLASEPALTPPASSSSTPAAMANGHVHAHATTSKGESLPNNLGEMDAKCGGCSKIIDQDNGGVVVAFGSSLWHVDCFRCNKCHQRVSADTNLLLLSDGSPVCGNCSYQCFVCKQAITEEAIMTGDESYHAHCFTCRTCKRRIEELVFAKTSQGIYCMACHNERVARSRRHAEAKRQRAARKEKEREKEEASRRAVVSSIAEEEAPPRSNPVAPSPIPHSSSTLLLSPAMTPHQQANGSPLGSPSATPNSFNSGRFPDQPGAATPDTEDERRPRELSVEQGLSTSRSVSPAGRQLAENLSLPASPHDAAKTQAARNPQPAARAQGDSAYGSSPSLGASQSLGSPSSFSPSSSRNNNNASNASTSTSNNALNVGLGVGPVGLGVPTSKADRRRSINPAMTFNLDSSNSTFAVEPRLSPLPPSPLRASFTDLQHQTDGANAPPRSPTSPSPAHAGAEGFPFKTPSLAAPDRLRDSEAQAPPPRTSSLPDQLSASSRPSISEPVESSSGPSATPELAPPVPSKAQLPAASSHYQTQEAPAPSENASDVDDSHVTPRLVAPNLPPMSFSLSDPDFALILNNIDKPASSDAAAVDSSSALSSPASPMRDANALARSPQMSTLSSHIPASTSDLSGPSRSRSPSATRLSPSDNQSERLLLRQRQPSAESQLSVASRTAGEGSSFASIVGLVAEAKHEGKERVEVDLDVLSGIVSEVEELKETVKNWKGKFAGIKRTSQQYSEGLTVAGEEYDKELAIRRELEAEVIRLKAQVHAQTARLSVISGDERRQENMRRRSHDLASSLTGLEKDLSRLRAQRDMTLAEVEELSASRITTDATASTEEAAANLSKSLTSRLDTIKEQYREELEPLTAQREALQREIAELRETREQFLEESTALAAKNEELAELNTQLSRQAESVQEMLARQRAPTIFNKPSLGRSHPSASPSMSSLATSATLQEVPEETARVVKVTNNKPEHIEAAPARRFKWYKSSKGPDASNVSSASISRPLNLPQHALVDGVKGGAGGRGGGMQRPSTEFFGIKEHAFQQHSTMRFTRCELCQEKMWGLQEVRCALCGIVCHSKCAEKLPKSCAGGKNGGDSLDGPLPPSMFGRDLIEQVVADKRDVPVIVTKCIAAVEVVGMEYEGIYRKTGGSSQSKQITQLFERGDYDAFDLADVEAFNDISSVTSVLKTYFRQLPNPLLTHKLHESFVAAASIRDANNKHSALCALLKELPKEHYNTLRALMLHLNRVTQLSSANLMTSQNLGVVFGPTLMRSSDPNREFGDMAGKALSIQWMVENAAQVFADSSATPSATS